MLKGLVEAHPIQISDHRYASEAALRQIPAPLTTKHAFQLLACRQQIAHIVGGVGELSVTELIDTAPITALGTLVQLTYAANDVRYLLPARQKLEAMLRREDRWDLAKRCFGCIPVIADLDRMRFNQTFEH